MIVLNKHQIQHISLLFMGLMDLNTWMQWTCLQTSRKICQERITLCWRI